MATPKTVEDGILFCSTTKVKLPSLTCHYGLWQCPPLFGFYPSIIFHAHIFISPRLFYTIKESNNFVHIPKWGKMRALEDRFGVTIAILSASTMQKSYFLKMESSAEAEETKESTARLTLTPDATFIASGVYGRGDFRRNRHFI
jgi:hypothetical protein